MTNTVRYLRPLASIAGIALFVCVIQHTGPGVVLDKIHLLGCGFIVMILLSGIRHLLRAIAWSYCVQTDGPRPPALTLLGPRLMGEALDDVTPAGPLLGESAKVVVISRLIPAQAGVSSVVIENLVYAIGALLFMLSGLTEALLKLGTLKEFRWIGGGLLICLVASMAIACWIVTQRLLLVGTVFDYLKRVELRCAFLMRYESTLREVEKSIYDFFLARRRLFFAVLAIEIATNFIGVGEAYLILTITTAHKSFFAAYLVESASRAVQLAFSFVPLGLGIQEAAAAATLQAFGYAASEGVSLAIIRKIRTAFWVAVGLPLAAKYAIAFPQREESSI